MKIKGNYFDFANALGKRESSGFYDRVNTLGFLGKFQFGKPRLYDLGLSIDNWKPHNQPLKLFLTKENFLASKDIQDNVFLLHVIDWKKRIEKRFNAYLNPPQAITIMKDDNHKELIPYNDEYVWNADHEIIPLTISGMIAGVHLKGLGTNELPGLTQFLEKGIDGKDAYDTCISEYIVSFGGYDLSVLPVPFPMVVKD